MTQQFSMQTERLAAAHHLGAPLAVYRASVRSSNLLYTLIGAVLVGGLVVQGIHSHQWGVLLPILLILLLLWGLLESTFWVRSLRLVVCTEGVLRLWNDEAESIRWEEIRELWRDRHGQYAFSRADGTRFIINHVVRHADELVTIDGATYWDMLFGDEAPTEMRAGLLLARNDELFGRLRRILDVLAQGLLETTGTLAINRDDESIRKLLLEIITDLSERDSPI